MKFGDFLELVGSLPFFDLATAVQLSGEARPVLRIQLHRWVKAGNLLHLRRGMYTMADRYRRTPVHPAVLANALYAPSYLSGVWALGFFGLIPEKVVAYTSVTTRVPRRFENAFGAFEYRHLKLSFFFGYKAAVIQDENVFLAEPEKALLDFWHLNAGEWDPARMSEMRFQNHDAVNRKRLSDYARRSASPRLSRAVAAWLERADAQREGTVEL